MASYDRHKDAIKRKGYHSPNFPCTYCLKETGHKYGINNKRHKVAKKVK